MSDGAFVVKELKTMFIHGKPFSELDETDLQSLIDDQVPEGKIIEYKSSLLGNSDKNKKEFLADVSSFSNSAGGYLFYGINEVGGLPQELIGLCDINPDAQILRLENLLRDGIAPRIPNLKIRSIAIENKGPVIAIYLPKSWVSPHMVTFAGSSKFFTRNSAGKYPLDVFELRLAFDATNVEGERLRTFRTDRIGRIVAGETPIPLEEQAKVIMHLIPVSAFDTGVQYDLRELQLSPNPENLAPIDATYGSNLRFNFDGILTFEKPSNTDPAISYLQVFRNGIIESACTSLFRYREKIHFIPSIVFEEEIVQSLGKFFKVHNTLEIEPPYFLLISLVGVEGYNLPTKKIYGYSDNIIDRNDLLVPEILVEDSSLPPETILKPAFDAIWNAAGQPQSPFYDKEGNWNPRG